MSSTQSDLETVNRALKNAEIELSEARSYIHQLVISIDFVNTDRRRLESDIATLNFDLQDAQRGRHEVEKRTDRLRLEVNRLRHDLRQALHRSRQNHHVAGNVKLVQAKNREQRSGSCDITALQTKVTDIEEELQAVQRDEHDSTTSQQLKSINSRQRTLSQQSSVEL